MAQNNTNPSNSPNANNPGNPYVPWPVRKGIFRSIGQNDFAVPTREPSPIVEMPMSPSSARSSPARFIPGYNRSMSPRITIEESPFSPPPQMSATTAASVMSPPVFVNPQPPPPLLLKSPQGAVALANPVYSNPNPCPVVRDVPIQQIPPLSSSEVIEIQRRGAEDGTR